MPGAAPAAERAPVPVLRACRDSPAHPAPAIAPHLRTAVAWTTAPARAPAPSARPARRVRPAAAAAPRPGVFRAADRPVAPRLPRRRPATARSAPPVRRARAPALRRMRGPSISIPAQRTPTRRVASGPALASGFRLARRAPQARPASPESVRRRPPASGTVGPAPAGAPRVSPVRRVRRAPAPAAAPGAVRAAPLRHRPSASCALASAVSRPARMA